MKRQFAIALYANEAESEDELTFKKNDILQILHLDYSGMEGWWLCKLLKSNKTGLAAGNRLKVVEDKKMLLKINSILNSTKTDSSSSFDTKSENSRNKSNSIISGSDSTTSVMSSNSSNNSSVSIDSTSTSYSTRMQSLSLQPIMPVKDGNIDQQPKQQPQQDTTVAKPKLVLPAKLKSAAISASKTSFLTESTENILNMRTNLCKFKATAIANDADEADGDDYDYDIPANKPLEETANEKESTTISSETCRKSMSPTIDSGISTSSLASYGTQNSKENVLQSKLADDSTSSTSSDSFSSGSSNTKDFNFQVDYSNQMEQFRGICSQLRKGAATSNAEIIAIKTLLFSLKGLVYEFLVSSLKRIKEEHACFHPNLNVFNKFKTYYRQIKEFYLYFESTLIQITNVYQWCYETLAKNTVNELNELLGKLSYFSELTIGLDQLIEDAEVFSYHSEISLTKYLKVEGTAQSTVVDQDYEYEYDNNNNNVATEANSNTNCDNKQYDYDIYERIDNDVENEDDSDYCLIDDESNEASNQDTIKNVDEVIYSNLSKSIDIKMNRSREESTMPLPQCMTLKRNEEKIKREIKAAGNHDNGQKITMVDQMLLKFYLKHIEENLNELNSVYEELMNKLANAESIEDDLKEEGLGHKLAINGHKLVFICDTLERNLHSSHLKAALYEVSGNLCEALKLYMIRIKTQTLSTMSSQSPIQKQRTLVTESLKNVLGASNKFKQTIIKYYFKSY